MTSDTSTSVIQFVLLAAILLAPWFYRRSRELGSFRSGLKNKLPDTLQSGTRRDRKSEILATPSRHAEVERRRKSPNRTKTGSGGRRGDSRICAAKMASAPIVGEWFLSAQKNRQGSCWLNFCCLANAMWL